MGEVARFAGPALAALLTGMLVRAYPVDWLPRWYWLPMMGVVFVLYLEAYRLFREYWRGEEEEEELWRP